MFLFIFPPGSDSDVAQQTFTRRLRKQPNKKNLTTYLHVETTQLDNWMCGGRF